MTEQNPSETTDSTPTVEPTEPERAGASVAMFTIDCADPGAEGAFYAAFLGLEIAYQDENAVMLAGADGPAIGFGRVDNYHPPAWPDEGSDKQFHLDLKVADIPAAEAAAVALGATVPAEQPGETWRVLLDPAGHPFCLTRWGG